MSTSKIEDVSERDVLETNDPKGEQAERADKIEAEPSLSPAAEQGAAALSNIGERKSSELFSDKPDAD